MRERSSALWRALLLAVLLGVPVAACQGAASLPEPAPSPAQPTARAAPVSNPGLPSAALTPTPASLQTGKPTLTATPTPNQLAAAFRYSAVSASYHTCLLRMDGVAICWGYGISPPRGRYSAISVGGFFACGTLTDGTLRCWGDRRYNRYGQMDPPEGEFQSVSAGGEHACGIRTGGTVECWGRNTDVQGSGQGTGGADGIFRSVSAGDGYTCGIRRDGAAQCWGDRYDDRATPPGGKFQSVSAGWSHACGLRADGTAACWGSNREGQATAPDGIFTAISAGSEHTCGLRPDGSAVCWGRNGHGRATPPGGAFVSIAAGEQHTCALRPDGSPRCWGKDVNGMATPPGIPVDHLYTCAAGGESGLQCRRDDPYDRRAAPAGDFVAVAADPKRLCALRAGGTVECHNYDHYWAPDLTLPGSGYVAVDAAEAYVCGLRADSKLLCASHRDMQNAILIPGSFQAVSVGANYACAVSTGGKARCWSHTGDILATQEHIPPTAPPPYDDFSGISGGKWHACGVRAGGQAVCWGDNYGYAIYCTDCNDAPPDQPCMPICGLTRRTDYIGQAAPPDYPFRTVSAGYMHTCGIRADDGGAECWGRGRTTPPPGAFTAISAAGWFTCGIGAGGKAKCWGGDGFANDPLPVVASDCLTPAQDDGPCHRSYYRIRQAQPAAGEFVSVASGGNFGCGARADGALKCWGRIPGVITVTR